MTTNALDPIIRAQAHVLRLQLEVNAGCLTHERAKHQLERLAACLAEITEPVEPDQAIEFGEVRSLMDAQRFRNVPPVKAAGRDAVLRRIPGHSYGRFFVIDGGKS